MSSNEHVDPRPRRTTRFWGMVVAGPAVALATFVGSQAAPSDDEAAAITAVTRAAMSSMQQITGLDALSTDPDVNAAHTQRTGTFTNASRPGLRLLTRDRIAAAQAAGAARLETYFTGDQLTWFDAFNDEIQERYDGLTMPVGAPGSPEADPTVTSNYILTGGADSFDEVKVVVTDAGATITGSARIWSSSAMVEKEETTIDHVAAAVNFSAHLVRTGATWKVDRYHDTFAPGSEP